MAGIMAAGITVFGHGFGSSSSKKHLIYYDFLWAFSLSSPQEVIFLILKASIFHSSEIHFI